MPLPKGDVHKKKEVIQDVTLHDLDVANARPQVPTLCLLSPLSEWQFELWVHNICLRFVAVSKITEVG